MASGIIITPDITLHQIEAARQKSSQQSGTYMLIALAVGLWLLSRGGGGRKMW